MEFASCYVHIPFCKSKCDYCDFYSVSGYTDKYEAYLQALSKEVCIQAKNLKDRLLFTSLYIGGGTPNIIPANQLTKFILVLKNELNFTDNCEFTIEANPGLSKFSDFEFLLASGVNRLSLGIQSFQTDLLQILGRIHNSEQAQDTIGKASQAGFKNINLDLIFGIPEQTLSTWQEDLQTALTFNPAHISTYCLTLTEAAPLAQKLREEGKELPNQELTQAMMQLAREILSKAGYEHYEISNFAIPGKACRHNLNYWQPGFYLGLGAGSFSFLGTKRRNNCADLSSYIKALSAGEIPQENIEEITPEIAFGEKVMLNLRLLQEGLNLDDPIISKESELKRELERKAENLIQDGFLDLSENKLKLTEKGIYLADEIISSLI